MNVRYGRDLKRGLAFQDHVAGLFLNIGMPLTCWSAVENQISRGESRQGVEIKLDDRLCETGNLFIEVRERSHPQAEWHGSTFDQPSTWALAIGDYDRLFVLSTRLLLGLRPFYKVVATETSEGWLLPAGDAERHALFFLPPPILVPFSRRPKPDPDWDF